MSVSGELLCSFELLKPLDSSALKSHIKKSRNKRQSMLNSPVSNLWSGLMDWTQSLVPCDIYLTRTDSATACTLRTAKLLIVSSLCRVVRVKAHQHLSCRSKTGLLTLLGAMDSWRSTRMQTSRDALLVYDENLV